MIRVFLAVVLLSVLSPIICAGETVARLNVRPMAAPKPALKHLLLPEVRELTPGNPAQWYLRCFAEQRNFFFNKDSVAQRERYRSMLLAELRTQKLNGYGGYALRQADWGARMDALDWQVTQRIQTEGTDLSLPELEPLQILAMSLQARFRIEVAGAHFDDAIRTAKTMFAFARHLGEHPVEAANRTGLFVANLAVDTLDEMVQQPGCPNLFWALTDLPYPLVDIRKGLQGGRALVETDMRAVREDAPMTEDEIEKLVSRLSGVMSFAREQKGRPPRSLRTGLKARVQDPERLNAARARLIEAGDAEKVAREFLAAASFPPMQVVLLDEKHAYEIRRDEDLKLLGLAPWQIDHLLAGRERKGSADGLLAELLPPVIELRRAQARLEQRLDLLRHVEALRLYAAAHGAKLPDKLAECAMPLPADPFTGKPFTYTVEAGVAHLRGRPPQSDEKLAQHPVHYEIRVQK